MIGDCLLFRAQLHRQVAEKLCAEFAYNHSVQKLLLREGKNRSRENHKSTLWFCAALCRQAPSPALSDLAGGDSA